MYRIFLVVFILSITSISLLAQLEGFEKIDSLLNELPTAQGDTNEVTIFIELSSMYAFQDAEEGIKYGKKGVQLAKHLGWNRGLAQCYTHLGSCYYVKGEFSTAIDYLNKSLKINTEIGETEEAAVNLGNLGILFRMQGKLSKALEYYILAMKKNEENNDDSNLAMNINNIASIYELQGNYSKALEYYFKALEINETQNNKLNIIANLVNIGSLYKEIGKYDKALAHTKKALEIAEEKKYKRRIVAVLSSIGSLYASNNSYDSAMVYFQRTIEMNIDLKANRDLGSNYSNIGNLKLKQEKYIEAVKNYQKSLNKFKKYGSELDIALVNINLASIYIDLLDTNSYVKESDRRRYIKSVGNIPELNKILEMLYQAQAVSEEQKAIKSLSISHKLLYKANLMRGNHKEALSNYKQFTILKDSINTESNSDKIAKLEKAREDDLKQKEIEKQKLKIEEQEKRERLILYFSIGFIIVMSAVMFVIYRLLKRSDKLLYNVLPVSIAKRLKNKEHPISDYFSQASIVFIDIINFTEMAKNEDPRKVVETLNNIFTHYDIIAKKYGLEKIKTIGDSYMAAAGIPEVQQDNSYRAIQMALEVKELMKDYKSAEGNNIEVRIGLDCGPVVAGVIGENKFIYDMWSDAVNTASRMETSSKAGKVHITEHFKNTISQYDDFEYVERGEIEIKGKGKMKTYFVDNKLTSVN